MSTRNQILEAQRQVEAYFFEWRAGREQLLSQRDAAEKEEEFEYRQAIESVEAEFQRNMRQTQNLFDDQLLKHTEKFCRVILDKLAAVANNAPQLNTLSTCRLSPSTAQPTTGPFDPSQTLGSDPMVVQRVIEPLNTASSLSAYPRSAVDDSPTKSLKAKRKLDTQVDSQCGHGFPKRTRPSGQFTGVVYPIFAELYLGYWGKDKIRYVVILLPWGDLSPAGLAGTLKGTGLLNKPAKCYTIDRTTGEISGWAKGYEDGGRLVTKREFPVMYFDGDQAVSWLQARDLSILNFEAPDADSIPYYDDARNWYAKAQPQRFDSYQHMKDYYSANGHPKLFSSVRQPPPSSQTPDAPPTSFGTVDDAALSPSSPRTEDCIVYKGLAPAETNTAAGEPQPRSSPLDVAKSPVSSVPQGEANTSHSKELAPLRVVHTAPPNDQQPVQSVIAAQVTAVAPPPTSEMSDSSSAISSPRIGVQNSVSATSRTSTPFSGKMASEDLFEIAYYVDESGGKFRKQEDGPCLRMAVDKSANICETSPAQSAEVKINPHDIARVDVIPLDNISGDNISGAPHIVSLVLKDDAEGPRKQQLVFETSKVMGRQEVGCIHARRFCAWLKRVNPAIDYRNQRYNGPAALRAMEFELYVILQLWLRLK